MIVLYSVFHFIFHGLIIYRLNEQLDPVGLLAQLVERCTCIAEVKGSNHEQTQLLFSKLPLCNFDRDKRGGLKLRRSSSYVTGSLCLRMW